LYYKKDWSLSRISKELGYAKGTVRNKLVEVGIDIRAKAENDEDSSSRMKIQEMRSRGMSYKAIADTFNMRRIPTRSGERK
jgi:hypothetical protein